MKQTNERLCALAQKGDAAALDSLIDNNKSFIGKVANDLFRSMNLAQSGLNLDTDDLKQAGNLGLWKAVPKFDAARGMKFLTYAAPAIRNAMMDMVRDAFAAFEQRMVTEDKDGICYQRVSLDDVLPGEEQLRRIEAIADPYAMQPQSIMEEQESRRELYDGLKRLTQREQTYLLYRYGFTDGEEHPLIGTAIYFHLTKGRAKKTEEQGAVDSVCSRLFPSQQYHPGHVFARPSFSYVSIFNGPTTNGIDSTSWTATPSVPASPVQCKDAPAAELLHIHRIPESPPHHGAEHPHSARRDGSILPPGQFQPTEQVARQ